MKRYVVPSRFLKAYLAVAMATAVDWVGIASSLGKTRNDIKLLRKGATWSFPTIQAAVDVAKPGDTINISAGYYYENVKISRSGTAAKPIVLQGPADGVVVIDGADEKLQIPGSGKWTKAEDGIYKTNVVYDGRVNEATNTAVSKVDNQRLISGYSSLPYLRKQTRGEGSYREGTTVYIYLNGDKDPNKVGLNIAQAEGALTLENASNWQIRNIDVRHGGLAGIYLKGAKFADVEISGVTVRNSFYGIATDMKSGANVRVFNAKVINGYDGINQQWVSAYRRGDGNGTQHREPQQMVGILMYARNSEVSNSIVDGAFDGMRVNGSNIRVHHNTIRNISDDGIELESTNTRNIFFYNNLVYDALVGVSFTSNTPGPIYIYRNIFDTSRRQLWQKGNPNKYNTGYNLKSGQDWAKKAENIKFYHNTFYASGLNLWEKIGDAAPDNWNGYDFVNNIFFSKADNYNYQGSKPKNYWSNNLYRGRDCPSNETGKICADPQFVNPGGSSARVEPRNLHLELRSPALNKGTNYPATKGWPDSVANYAGGRDIGAWEKGVEMRIGASVSPPVAQ